MQCRVPYRENNIRVISRRSSWSKIGSEELREDGASKKPSGERLTPVTKKAKLRRMRWEGDINKSDRAINTPLRAQGASLEREGC